MEIQERDEYGRIRKDYVPSKKTEEIIEELRKLKVTDEALEVITEELAEKDLLISNLGLQLVEEKIKGTQKDLLISSLGQEISKVKIDLLLMKGGV